MCGQEFVSRWTLKRHKENTAIVQCGICTAKFCNKYDLKLHIAEHKSKCEICGGNYRFIDWHKKVFTELIS